MAEQKTRSHVPLAFQNVTFMRGDRVILDDVSLELHHGETLALLGPSGSGKTTLVKLALGFLKPNAGQVWVHGRDITDLSERELMPIRAMTGVVFQKTGLFTSMEVAENVAFGLVESDLSEEEIAARVRRALEAVGLTGFGDRMPDQLSGGQAQRVAIARAIVMEPSLMLYDDPTQGLDPMLALNIVEQINRQSEQGVTCLLVTQQLEYARLCASRFALLDGARIRYAGPYQGLHDLDNAFAQSFFEVLEGGALTTPTAPPQTPTLH